MNEIDINRYLVMDDKIKSIYKGIISSNELFTIEKDIKSLYIVNTDPNYLPGSHWVAVYSYNGTCEIFDSLGNKPSKYNRDFYKFLNDYKKSIYSIVKLQNDESKLCGAYCIYYCYLKSRNFTLNEIVNTFSSNKLMNDYLVSNFLYNHFI